MFGFLGRGGSAPGLLTDEAVRMVAEGTLTLIDVREHGEVQMTGKAKGAIHIPLMMVPLHADPRNPDCMEGLSTGKPIAVYCASGARSQSAMQVLHRLGYETIHNLGGLHDWVAAGGSVTR